MQPPGQSFTMEVQRQMPNGHLPKTNVKWTFTKWTFTKWTFTKWTFTKWTFTKKHQIQGNGLIPVTMKILYNSVYSNIYNNVDPNMVFRLMYFPVSSDSSSSSTSWNVGWLLLKSLFSDAWFSGVSTWSVRLLSSASQCPFPKYQLFTYLKNYHAYFQILHVFHNACNKYTCRNLFGI